MCSRDQDAARNRGGGRPWRGSRRNASAPAVVRPTARYVYGSLTRTAANAVVDGIIAIQFRGTKCPITQGSTVLASAIAAA